MILQQITVGPYDTDPDMNDTAMAQINRLLNAGAELIQVLGVNADDWNQLVYVLDVEEARKPIGDDGVDF